MIHIKDKKDCCGCYACVQKCPKQCIAMNIDEEGFSYPIVDISKCIDCGLCEKVCPVINRSASRVPLAVLAAKSNEEKIRLQSSSGGIFTLLAEQCIKEGGIVFGARFDSEWNVVHGYATSLDQLAAFRSSKYLQSRIGTSFKEAEQFLKKGYQVLFTGTPCQIAGLKKFLRKDYENLLSVEVFCHSVPSPKIWQNYLGEVLSFLKWNKSDIEKINFRNKDKSWKRYHFTIQHKNGKVFDQVASDNLYMRGFIGGLYTRPSCYACPAKKLVSGSDLTIGDYWGIQRLNADYDDDKGVSAVLVNTQKGFNKVHSLSMSTLDMDFQQLCFYNPAVVHLAKPSPKRDEFFLSKDKSVLKRIQKFCKYPLSVRIKKILYNAVASIISKDNISFLKKVVK